MRAYAYIGLVLALLAFAWWYSDRQYDAGYTAATAEYESAMREDLEKVLEKNKRLQGEIDALTADLLELEDRRQTQYEIIRDEVTVYVENNPDCDLSRGAVGLLNRAALSGLPATGDTALSETEKRAPSTVTQPAAVGHCIGWAAKYNELAGRHDRLLDVLEKAGL